MLQPRRPGAGTARPDLAPVQPPFPVTAPYRTVPAPRPLGDDPFVVLDDAWPAARRRRAQRLRTDPCGVLVRDPADPDNDGLLAAVLAAWQLLPHPRQGGTVRLPGLRVDLRSGDAEGPDLPPGLGQAERLAAAWGLACADDLVVLRRRGDTATAELLAVAFPSGWPPRRRAGADLTVLHGPVADGERLRRAGGALAEALLTKGPYRQHVWGLDPDGRLDRDPSAPDAPVPSCPLPRHWHLRVERQTTMALPALGRALFLIRPYLVPLPQLTPPQRLVLADAVAGMSPAALTYKGIAVVRDGLLAWLRTPVS